jgi:hypothetical protein
MLFTKTTFVRRRPRWLARDRVRDRVLRFCQDGKRGSAEMTFSAIFRGARCGRFYKRR